MTRTFVVWWVVSQGVLFIRLFVCSFVCLLRVCVCCNSPRVFPAPMGEMSISMCARRYIQEDPNTAVIVSHDRTFLNRVISDVIHLAK